uniref:Transmembrane protein n=1 Tax=Tetradesmus obliquus TaxID=3088 RepID=A0A383WHF7_TETOB|eukprot:jgi/Sobl393_1/2711/SZX76693.1
MTPPTAAATAAVTAAATVNTQTLDSSVAGALSIYSRARPAGPGFTGTHDWGGWLDLNPDPFAVWADAATLLTPNSSSNSSGNNSSRLRRALLQEFLASSRNLLPYGMAGTSRQLLQSAAGGTGQVPVQGRVSIRESAFDAGSSSSSNDTTALDNSGDIVVVGGPPADPNTPLPAQINPNDSNSSTGDGSGKVPTPTPPPQGPSDGSAQASQAPLPTVDLPNLAMRPKLLIVLAAIAAPSCVALCAVCIAAGVIYKRRKRQDQEQRQQQQQQQQQASGAHVPGAGSPAGNSNQKASSKARRRLPSGAGSNINGSSSSNSQSMGSPVPHSSSKQGRLGSWAGSVAGMASTVAAAIGSRLRSSQAGAAYKVPGLEPAAARGANRGSLDLAVPAGERGPTLPGARAASVLMPAAEAAQLAKQVSGSSRQEPVKAATMATGQPAAVPAMWLLPTASPSGRHPGAAADWGVAGGLQPSSRGSPRAAAGAAGPGGYGSYDLQEDEAGEVVGGSTFLLPSRSRVNLKVSLNSPTAARQQQLGSPRSPPAWS